MKQILSFAVLQHSKANVAHIAGHGIGFVSRM
jgi:hypothetical protein